jgi:hypothetical protein
MDNGNLGLRPMSDDPTNISAGRDAYVAGRDIVLRLGSAAGRQAKSGVRMDARFRYLGKGRRGLVIKNYGPEVIHNLNLEFPEELEGMTYVDPGFPLKHLPVGKSVTITCLLTVSRNFSYFDLTITGQTPDGTPVRQEVFVDLGI